MKKLRDMSEEEILVEALRAVPEYRERIRATHKFILDDCVRAAMNRIEACFRADQGLKPYGAMPERDRRELNVLLAHYRPKLIEEIEPIQIRYMRQRVVSDISTVTAQNIIPAAFAKEGLVAEVEGQTHRAKVEIQLAPSTRVKFYVRYRDLNTRDGLADDLVRAVLDLKDAVTRLGSGVMVTKK